MRFRVSILVIVFGIMLANTVQASILFDNGAAVEEGPNMRFNFFGWSTFDDFVLTGDSLVTGFRWTQFEEEQLAYVSTTLLLFGGIPAPSTLIASFDVVANRIANGMLIDVPSYVPFATSDELLGVNYAVMVSPTFLSAGTYYFGIHHEIEGGLSGGVTLIANSLGGDDSISGFYQDNRYYEDPAVFGLTEDGPSHSNSGYTAFAVTGNVIPEPTTFIVWSFLAFCGVAYARRRKRRR